MMNKYLRKGLLEIILGISCLALGYYWMEGQNNWYKPMMILGVILFGIGFLNLVYRIIRKIDRNSLLEFRKSKKDQ